MRVNERLIDYRVLPHVRNRDSPDKVFPATRAL